MFTPLAIVIIVLVVLFCIYGVWVISNLEGYPEPKKGEIWIFCERSPNPWISNKYSEVLITGIKDGWVRYCCIKKHGKKIERDESENDASNEIGNFMMMYYKKKVNAKFVVGEEYKDIEEKTYTCISLDGEKEYPDAYKDWHEKTKLIQKEPVIHKRDYPIILLCEDEDGCKMWVSISKEGISPCGNVTIAFDECYEKEEKQ